MNKLRSRELKLKWVAQDPMKSMQDHSSQVPSEEKNKVSPYASGTPFPPVLPSS